LTARPGVAAGLAGGATPAGGTAAGAQAGERWPRPTGTTVDHGSADPVGGLRSAHPPVARGVPETPGSTAGSARRTARSAPPGAGRGLGGPAPHLAAGPARRSRTGRAAAGPGLLGRAGSARCALVPPRLPPGRTGARLRVPRRRCLRACPAGIAGGAGGPVSTRHDSRSTMVVPPHTRGTPVLC